MTGRQVTYEALQRLWVSSVQLGNQGLVASVCEELNLFHFNYFYFKLKLLLVASDFLIGHYSFRDK